MRNITMTGTIVLSPEDSAQIRNSVLSPSAEYLQNRQVYFDKLASSMTIHSEGSNTTVEFDDLDLSNLDKLIEEENRLSKARILEKDSDYISTTVEVSFVGGQNRKDSLFKTMNSSFLSDELNNVYDCIKKVEKAENQGCNLTDAA